VFDEDIVGFHENNRSVNKIAQLKIYNKASVKEGLPVDTHLNMKDFGVVLLGYFAL
jgi:hypothetical protein